MLIDSKSIFAHRGFWMNSFPQNSIDSFEAAENKGFSIETDLRSFNGDVVISHDSILSESNVRLSSLTQLNSSFALNIKEDGLQSKIVDLREWIKSSSSFVFDGSLPEMYRYKNLGIEHALRISEYERELAWDCNTVWLDSFESDWWIDDISLIENLQGKNVIIVSPELHGREHRNLWSYLRESRQKGRFNFSICTDMPVEFAAW
jgi:glycerophosphoryl diester phosphodiesterase